MDSEIQEALQRAKQRLKDAKPNIEKRHEEGVQNATEEPDILKSGCKDDLRSKRGEKKQENDTLP